jgi:formylglycine-generating enzyme required for sulfatase activity
MAGNISQWCWNWGGGPGTGQSGTDPRGPDQGGGTKVIRGGNNAYVSQCAARAGNHYEYGSLGIGFRLARGRSSGAGGGTQPGGGGTQPGGGVVEVDTTPPVLTLPEAVSVNATNVWYAPVTFGNASATDNSGRYGLVYSHVSGGNFPIGTTPVTVTAFDSAGNVTKGTFNVTVIPPIKSTGATAVTFRQRTDGSKIVDVSYDLYGSTADVALAVSYDGGATFESVSSLKGDVGAGIAVGKGKRIAWSAGTDHPNADESNVKVRVTAQTPTGTITGVEGIFAPIAAGTYSMGNLIGDGDITDAGRVSVTLSSYYMAVNNTTKAQWDSVRAWGTAHGYTDLVEGVGKAANHPVQTISWWDAVKWANAASEKEGLDPVYYFSGGSGIQIYRTGVDGFVLCDWSANGYRLPTEAEWEVAARGGLNGKRFPLGDTISHADANYLVQDSPPYDLSGAVNGYHPTYGAAGVPFTSPVGSFPANGYGLCDMAGNVGQWCWDLYENQYAGGNDPRGPDRGVGRVLRGGSWMDNPKLLRCANRRVEVMANSTLGFRLTRGRPEGAPTETLSEVGLVDTKPPVLTLPEAVFVNATYSSGASVTFSGVKATDNKVTYSHFSGDTFPVGTTPVTVTAIDSVGNTATGSFAVTVFPPVTFFQRTDGSKIVDIYYDLPGDTSHVEVEVSYDDGMTYRSVSSLRGDVGAGITAGPGKHVEWNAEVDGPRTYTTYSRAPNVRVRVTAHIPKDIIGGAGGTFVPVAAGTYSMGVLIGDSIITEVGTMDVTLSPYYMAANNTTKAQWDMVRAWGVSHGYPDLAEGGGKAANHPVQTVSWYDVIKWANAASEKEGLTPSYRVDGRVVRTGTSDAVTCDWSANGYRLPTDAEWEIAARGGSRGSFDYNENYISGNASEGVDRARLVDGYHPANKAGLEGSYSGYGDALYASPEIVYQWCWDRYAASYAGGTDPRGAVADSRRVMRGVYLFVLPSLGGKVSAYRGGDAPANTHSSLGFRLARGWSSGTGKAMLSAGGLVDTGIPEFTATPVSVQATSPIGAMVTFPEQLGSEMPPSTFTYSPASGTTFPLGTTTVTVTASNDVGNTTTQKFSVTVRDTTAPVLSLPSNVTAKATSESGASVVYGAATATDEVSVSPTITYSKASGSIFPIGTTAVTVTAEDGAGNVATGEFSVTVRDTTAPVISLPPNVTAKATSESGASVVYGAATATDEVSISPTITYSKASGSIFPIGTTAVTVTAEDGAGNAATGEFSVTVRQKPKFRSVPANLVLTTDPSGHVALPDYTPLIELSSDATTVIIQQSPAAGEVLTGGTFTLKWRVRDGAGNEAAAESVVEVRKFPRIVGQPRHMQVRPKASVLFGVEADGYGPLSYQWKRNGTPISGGTLSTLSLPNVQVAQTGSYTVTVTNSIGSVESEAGQLSFADLKALEGSYQALLKHDNNATSIEPGSPGRLSLMVTKTGGLSGKLEYLGETFSLSGALTPEMKFIKMIPRKGSQRWLVVVLEMDTLADELRATVTEAGSLLGGAGTLVRQPLYTTNRPAPQAGLFTARLNPDVTHGTGPTVGGVLAVAVTPRGTVTVTGTLPDGTLLSSAGQLQRDGSVPFYNGLYANLFPKAGYIAGVVSLDPVSDSPAVVGSLEWNKPRQAKGLWAAGFMQLVEVIGSKYTVPGAKELVLADRTALTFTTSDSVAFAVTLNAANTFSVTQNKTTTLVLTLNKRNGVVAGSMTDVKTKKRRTLTGVVLQASGELSGIYLREADAGEWLLSELEPE